MNPENHETATSHEQSRGLPTFGQATAAATPDKLQRVEDKVRQLQAQAEVFGLLPIFPQRVRDFFARLVDTLADMAAAIDAIQDERAGRRP